jgi:hypothetical protein
MIEIKTMTEKELRESKVPYIKTESELVEYIGNLVDREHDYGTCVYAMSMAAVATYRYVGGKLGVTGCQASCADMDILRRNRMMNSGFMLLNYENLLYPQYCNKEYFPGWETLIKNNREHLAQKAQEKLAEHSDAHPDVIRHWKMLANA